MNAVLAANATEAQLQAAVETHLAFWGWDFYHDRAALSVVCRHCGKRTPVPARNRPGVPDLVAVGEGILLLSELKKVNGYRRPDQERWMRRLQRVERVVADFHDPRQFDALCTLIASGGRR